MRRESPTYWPRRSRVSGRFQRRTIAESCFCLHGPLPGLLSILFSSSLKPSGTVGFLESKVMVGMHPVASNNMCGTRPIQWEKLLSTVAGVVVVVVVAGT